MAASRFNPLPKALLAAGLAATALLAACGEHHAAPAQEASAPPPRPDALAGAPTNMPAPPPYPADAPPPPPPPPGERPGDKDVVYDLGPVVGPHDTMAPIPNPPETGPVHARPRQERPYRRPVMPHRPHGPRVRPAAPVAPRPPAHKRPAPTRPVARPSKPAAVKPVKPAAPAKPASSGTPKKPVPAASGAASRGVQPQPAVGDRGAKLTALQSTLRDAVARSAVLTAPAAKPDQAQDVTLTLPAGFATQVRDEAAKQGLQDAASSVNMTALLSGDGYKVVPDETQSQPLTVGQPTEFHWTVTAQPGARGPLHADVGADLLGGGDSALQLGAVTPHGGFHISPRAWGALLLVLLAVLVFAALSRGRGSRARRPREDRRRDDRLYQRPLDMGAAPPPRRDDEV